MDSSYLLQLLLIFLVTSCNFHKNKAYIYILIITGKLTFDIDDDNILLCLPPVLIDHKTAPDSKSRPLTCPSRVLTIINDPLLIYKIKLVSYIFLGKEYSTNLLNVI